MNFKVFAAIAVACVCSFNISSAQTKKSKGTSSKKAINTTINGEVVGASNGYVLIAPIMARDKKDSVQIVNSKFTYKTSLKEGAAYNISVAGGSEAIFFLEPGTFTMRFTSNTTPPTADINTTSHKSFNAFNSAIMPLINERSQLQSLMQRGATDSLNLAAATVQSKIQAVFEQYMSSPSEHPATQAFILLSNVESSSDASGLRKLYDNMPAPSKSHTYGVRALNLLNRATADDMGNIAPDFTLKDSSGKAVTLSSFRGKKFVLVDFWATWCGPCRAEFPALMEAQNKYASKDLVILGVSIDKDYNAWKNMLAKPNFTNWLHVWDGPQGPNQITQTLYSVPSIPRNFLLDKNGKVIARNLRGADVDRVLAQYVK